MSPLGPIKKHSLSFSSLFNSIICYTYLQVQTSVEWFLGFRINFQFELKNKLYARFEFQLKNKKIQNLTNK